MSISPSDTRFAIIAETVAGTTPATPTFLVFPFIQGTEPALASDVVTSEVVRANRSSEGQRKTNYRVEGGLNTQLRRAPVMDLLLQSALSGTWVTNNLNAGNTDTSFTVEKTMFAGATPFFHRFTGCQVSSMNISVSSESACDATFDIIGLDRNTATVIVTGATYTQPTATLPLTGLDITNVTVAGLTAVCRSIDFTVEHEREAHDQLGSASALRVQTGGIRKVMATMTFYRTDLSPDTLLAKSDAPVAVAFNLGTGTNGYRVEMPAANYNIPQDEVDGSKQLFTVEFVASFDGVLGTDLRISRLT